MTVTPESVLLPRQDLVVEAFDDALLIWDESTGTLHHLDIRAALVWEHMDGRPLQEIAVLIAQELDVERESLLDDLVTLGDNLVTRRLARVVAA